MPYITPQRGRTVGQLLTDRMTMTTKTPEEVIAGLEADLDEASEEIDRLATKANQLEADLDRERSNHRETERQRDDLDYRLQDEERGRRRAETRVAELENELYEARRSSGSRWVY